MRSLAGRESHPAVWDSVNWELSTTYFTLATLLQDYAPLSRKAQEQVDLNTLNFSQILIILHLCPLAGICNAFYMCLNHPLLCVFSPDRAWGDWGDDEVPEVLWPADWVSSSAALPVQSCHHPPPPGLYVPQLLSQPGGKECVIIQIYKIFFLIMFFCFYMY